MVKPRSATAVAEVERAAAAKPDIPPEVVEELADELTDKPYGRAKVQDARAEKPATRERKAAREPKCRPVSISLPDTMIEAMEEAAMENRRRGKGPKRISQMIRAALEKDGWKA